jgi:hypothetical protein
VRRAKQTPQTFCGAVVFDDFASGLVQEREAVHFQSRTTPLPCPFVPKGKSTMRHGDCDICKKGRIVWRTEEITFRQWSDKGHVRCRATLQVGMCTNCQAKTLDADSDAAFDAAFQRAYNEKRRREE